MVNLAKCQPFLKNNAYSVADLIPLLADSLFSESVTIQLIVILYAGDCAEPISSLTLSIQKT